MEQSVEKVIEIMDSFDKYSYARTLRFFEAYYPYDNEDVHYADVMLSMSQCKTIDELIEVRERLKEKTEKMGNVEILGKLPKALIEELKKDPVNEYWTSRIQYNLRFDVNSCYNENLFRLLKESKALTEHTCGECFINLSHCWEHSKYKELIIDEAKEKANIDVSELLETIAKRYKKFGENWEKFRGFKEGMNGYNSAKKTVEDDFEYLRQFNWRLLPWEKSLYSEIDREEQRKKEEIARRLKEKKIKAEEEERKRKEEERIKKEKKKEEEGSIKILAVVIGIIIFVIIMVLIIAYVPPEVGHWFEAILLWLAIMKVILK